MKSNKRISLLLRLLLSGGFLYIAYRSVSIDTLLATLAEISPIGALSLLLLYTLGQLVSSLRWRVFLQQVGIERTASDTARAFFFGMFVNMFGLGTVGGDLARALVLRPERGKRAGCLATVVADRVFGLVSLLTIGAVAILVVGPPNLGLYADLASWAVVAALLVGWVLGPRMILVLVPKEHRFRQAAEAVALAFPTKFSVFLRAAIPSMLLHTIQICMHIVIARELNAPLSAGYLFCVVPIINAASTLPLSFSGVGIREYLYGFFFIPLGLSPEICVAFGAIWIVVVTLVSAIGGIFFKPDIDDVAKEELDETETSVPHADYRRVRAA